jgi:ABC-type sugar transport system ATPase subunit
LSDRIVVLFRGRITARFDSRPFERERILEAAMGTERAVA